MSDYTASKDRYEKLAARRCGKSGLILPEVSLGLWHNFGSIDDYSNAITPEVIKKRFMKAVNE